MNLALPDTTPDSTSSRDSRSSEDHNDKMPAPDSLVQRPRLERSNSDNHVPFIRSKAEGRKSHSKGQQEVRTSDVAKEKHKPRSRQMSPARDALKTGSNHSPRDPRSKHRSSGGKHKEEKHGAHRSKDGKSSKAHRNSRRSHEKDGSRNSGHHSRRKQRKSEHPSAARHRRVALDLCPGEEFLDMADPSPLKRSLTRSNSDTFVCSRTSSNLMQSAAEALAELNAEKENDALDPAVDFEEPSSGSEDGCASSCDTGLLLGGKHVDSADDDDDKSQAHSIHSSQSHLKRANPLNLMSSILPIDKIVVPKFTVLPKVMTPKASGYECSDDENMSQCAKSRGPAEDAQRHSPVPQTDPNGESHLADDAAEEGDGSVASASRRHEGSASQQTSPKAATGLKKAFDAVATFGYLDKPLIKPVLGLLGRSQSENISSSELHLKDLTESFHAGDDAISDMPKNSGHRPRLARSASARNIGAPMIERLESLREYWRDNLKAQQEESAGQKVKATSMEVHLANTFASVLPDLQAPNNPVAAAKHTAPQRRQRQGARPHQEMQAAAKKLSGEEQQVLRPARRAGKDGESKGKQQPKSKGRRKRTPQRSKKHPSALEDNVIRGIDEAPPRSIARASSDRMLELMLSSGSLNLPIDME